jgi:hypothetical protein
LDFGISVLFVTFVNSFSKKTIYNGKHGGFYKRLEIILDYYSLNASALQIKLGYNAPVCLTSFLDEINQA